jgi:hypothetical protein
VIQRTFKEPNYKCRISELDGTKERDTVLFANDPNDARKRLEVRNFKVLSDPVPYDFAEWKTRAKAKADAAADAIKKKENYDFGKNAIWGELKDYLFDLFDLKCAYCENTMLAADWGAVEHYRPKNPVKGDSEHPNHPGYHWLAYEAENYLPTCNKCNGPKSNYFPLAAGSPRAYAAAEVANEKPLLLNPYKDDPRKHLTFQASETDEHFGPWAKGLTDQGKETRKLLQLNRGDLLTDRQHKQKSAVADFIVYWKLGLSPNPVIEQLENGALPFSWASLVAINAVMQVLPK